MITAASALLAYRIFRQIRPPFSQFLGLPKCKGVLYAEYIHIYTFYIILVPKSKGVLSVGGSYLPENTVTKVTKSHDSGSLRTVRLTKSHDYGGFRTVCSTKSHDSDSLHTVCLTKSYNSGGLLTVCLTKSHDSGGLRTRARSLARSPLRKRSNSTAAAASQPASCYGFTLL
jgi:hypothetical protein